MVDTPQVVFATNYMPCCGGVQTTASHNPAEYNGFKICGPKGKPIGADSGLKEIERIAVAIARHKVPSMDAVTTRDLSEPYRKHLLRSLNEPAPIKVAVDASNGMAGRWFPLVFSDVPNLQIVALNFEHDGEFVHPPNPLIDANLEELCGAVRGYQTAFGACFDGDADRCVFVDENGRIVRCDLITALLAQEYLREAPGSTIVYDLRSSRIVPEIIKRAGGTPRRQRVGHVFMKRALAESNAVFGGELSGHFYFRNFFFCDSGMLAFIAVLNVLARTRKSLSELIEPLDVYAASGERNFRNENRDETFALLSDKYADAEMDKLDGLTVQYRDWWFNVRSSNTEPLLRLNLEADDADLLERKLAELTPLLGTAVDH
jgi:phosphomannomutase